MNISQNEAIEKNYDPFIYQNLGLRRDHSFRSIPLVVPLAVEYNFMRISASGKGVQKLAIPAADIRLAESCFNFCTPFPLAEMHIKPGPKTKTLWAPDKMLPGAPLNFTLCRSHDRPGLKMLHGPHVSWLAVPIPYFLFSPFFLLSFLPSFSSFSPIFRASCRLRPLAVLQIFCNL